ncbi:MAG: MgtC/SapB family protein, partial [Clostridia bacterium]|nr:MgtC/SapB family protein [Clostridia bacterium]
MFEFLNFLRGDHLDTLTIVVRLFLAVFCGGIIGIERERKRRPAGFRTHILICLGAAMTTLTSQFIVLELKLFTDLARLGAQVIAGIGFIGAGTIIVTKRRQVKGLTTAAGLWTAAIVGLCCGAGFYEGAV